jgi:ribosome-binding factor A
VRPDEEADPRRFFGETDRSGKRNWKVQQLCKQVERAAAVTLAGECESHALLAAAVASVEPAPDSSRLMATVVLAPGKGAEHLADARAALARSAASFREEVARTIHRKRVPEIVFDVRLSEEVCRG